MKKFRYLKISRYKKLRYSTNNFKGNISLWTDDAKRLIKKVVKKNKFIIIGSSMGAWIALNQFNYFKNQIVGMLGIGSAPEFLDRLMWNKFPKKIKNEILKKGLAVINHGKDKKHQYPISYQLIKDGRRNNVFSKKIFNKIQISMFHGQKDEVVPVLFSRKVLSIFRSTCSST